jgi:hypothetical protein
VRDVCREHEIAWFSKLKERELWRSEYETQQDRQSGIARYVERYHHRPTSSSATRHRRRLQPPGKNRDRSDVVGQGGFAPPPTVARYK